jgi:hypothetical protein
MKTVFTQTAAVDEWCAGQGRRCAPSPGLTADQRRGVERYQALVECT